MSYFRIAALARGVLACAVLFLASVPAVAQDTRGPEINFAAAEGDLPTVTRILHSGFGVNTPSGDFGFTPLIKAAEWGQIEVVRLLLDRGADPGFTATRKAPAVELTASGRFPTPSSAEGTFKMEDSNLCTTRLALWTAQRVGS